MRGVCGVLRFYETWVAGISAHRWKRGFVTLSTDCFENFPFSWIGIPGLDCASAGIITSYRRELMAFSLEKGLTATYNRFHDRGELSEDIARLRALHVEMDQAVAAAYGWSDLDLGHGFHATKQGERYTFSESARRTVLDRLLALNHQLVVTLAAYIGDLLNKEGSGIH